MAFLAPAAAVSSTAGAAALAKGATMAAGSGLASGLAAGTALGSGAAMSAMPALSYAGSNLALPALASKGLAATTPGIFSQAAPALGGLKSFPGVFSQASPALGGLKSFAPLASQTAPSSFGAINQAVGLGDVGTKAANLPTMLKTASNAPQVGGNFTKGLLESGANIKPAPSLAKTGPGTITEKLALKPTIDPKQNFLTNFGNLIKNPSMDAAGDYLSAHPVASMAAGYGLLSAMKSNPKAPPQGVSLIRPYEFDYNPNAEAYATSPTVDSREQTFFDPVFTAQTPYEAPGPEYKRAAEGGLMGLAVGGPVEQMAAMNAVGANTGYPMAGINTAMYSNPMVQRPEAVNVISPSGDAGVSAYSGEPKFAKGGISDLGDYSDGGRLLKGPGDGVSDSIPAVIGKRQPARLADGEFVIPARIVSELGNGSTEAGARKLYAMMERIQATRKKSIGKKKVAVNSKADKHLPA